MTREGAWCLIRRSETPADVQLAPEGATELIELVPARTTETFHPDERVGAEEVIGGKRSDQRALVPGEGRCPLDNLPTRKRQAEVIGNPHPEADVEVGHGTMPSEATSGRGAKEPVVRETQGQADVRHDHHRGRVARDVAGLEAEFCVNQRRLRDGGRGDHRHITTRQNRDLDGLVRLGGDDGILLLRQARLGPDRERGDGDDGRHEETAKHLPLLVGGPQPYLPERFRLTWGGHSPIAKKKYYYNTLSSRWEILLG